MMIVVVENRDLLPFSVVELTVIDVLSDIVIYSIDREIYSEGIYDSETIRTHFVVIVHIK